MTHPYRWLLLSSGILAVTACNGGSGTPDPAPPANKAPVVVVANPDLDAPLGFAFEHDAGQAGTTFRDDDGDPLTVTVSLSDATRGLIPNGSVIAGTPTRGGRITATITASDGRGGSATDQFDLLLVPGRAAKLARPTLPTAAFAYSDTSAPLPAHLRVANVVATDNTPATNPVTDAGATLGRVLFYDTRLSLGDNVSCGSCHQQPFGFSDPARTSEGFAGGRTARHSTGLADARWYRRGRMFWDERAATLEDQVLMPIQDGTEMGMTLAALEVKLAAVDFYPQLFLDAFGTPEITRERIAAALAQFVRALVSAGAKFDRAFVGGGAPDFAGTLTAQEEAGRLLFTTPPNAGRSARCGACHETNTQSLDTIHNIGLDAVPTDIGAGAGRFKAPSLRNIAVRAPYMHDGRFVTLDQVIDHYDHGIQANPALAGVLTAPDGQPVRLGLTVDEKAALIAFLGTLTDEAFLDDPRFADPFPPR